MENLFAKTRQELIDYEEVLVGLVDLAIELGMSPRGVSLKNSLSKVRKEAIQYRDQHKQFEEVVTSLGYSSLANAIKALKMMSEKVKEVDKSRVPERFHKVPYVWLTNTDQKALTVSQAERKHRTIMPLIIEAWELAGEQENIREEILNSYLVTSADDFERDLYMYIHELEEEVTLPKPSVSYIRAFELAEVSLLNSRNLPPIAIAQLLDYADINEVKIKESESKMYQESILEENHWFDYLIGCYLTDKSPLSREELEEVLFGYRAAAGLVKMFKTEFSNNGLPGMRVSVWDQEVNLAAITQAYQAYKEKVKSNPNVFDLELKEAIEEAILCPQK
jgi:hypothetical protein